MITNVLRVLVVDDEYYARKAASKAISQMCGAQTVVAEAESGRQAIALLQQGGFDFVLTDVRMADTDGIALCHYIKEHLPQLPIIILSGYADFEYARKALSLNVCHYLLKPLDQEELRHAVKDSLEQSKNGRNTMLGELERLRATKALIACLYSRREIPESVTAQLDSSPFFVAVLQSQEALSMERREALQQALLVFTKEDGYVFYNDFGRNEIVLVLRRSQQEESVSEIQQLAESLVQGRFTIGVSKVMSDSANLQKLFRQAHSAHCDRLIRRKQTVFFYSKRETQASLLSHEEQESLRRLLTDSYKERMVEQAIELVNHLLSQRLIGAENCQNFQAAYLQIAEIINTRSYTLAQLEKGDEFNMGTREFCSSNISDFFCYSEAMAFLSSTIELLFQHSPALEQTGQDLVAQVEQIIQDEYASELSLYDTACSRLFVNPSYLSRLIKDRTGKTFSRLMLERRMAAAHLYLQSGRHSISEISYMVGYNKPSYFIERYKKYYGTTPGAWRSLEDE